MSSDDDLVLLDEWHVELYAESDLTAEVALEVRNRAAAALEDGARRITDALQPFGRTRFRVT